MRRLDGRIDRRIGHVGFQFCNIESHFGGIRIYRLFRHQVLFSHQAEVEIEVFIGLPSRSNRCTSRDDGFLAFDGKFDESKARVIAVCLIEFLHRVD